MTDEGDPSKNSAPGKLDPRIQVNAVALSSFAIFLFVIALDWFYNRHDPSVSSYFIYFGWIPAAVWLGSLVLPNLIEQTYNDIFRKQARRTRRARLVELLQSRRFASLFLWPLSLGEFLVLGFLVTNTGGLVTSPYISLLATFIVLGPYITNGTGSIILLGAFGCICMLTLELLDAELSQPLLPAPSMMFMWVNIATIVVAMTTAFLVKKVQLSEEVAVVDLDDGN